MFTLAYYTQNTQEPEPDPSITHTDYLEVKNAGTNEVNGYYKRTSGTLEQPILFEMEGTEYKIQRSLNYDDENPACWYILKNDLNTVLYVTNNFSGNICPCDSSLTWFTFVDGGIEPVPAVNHVDSIPTFEETDILCSNAGTTEANGTYKLIPKDEWSTNATLADITSASYMTAAVSAWVNGPFALIDCRSEYPPNSGNFMRNVYIRGSKALQTLYPDKWANRDVYNIYTANMVSLDADITSITSWNRANGESPTPTLSKAKI